MTRLFVTFILVMVASVSTASAERLHVETNGIDSSTCGARRSPCRSISRAIENASIGDVILVGPGRYGDANADGDFNDSGDELAEVGFGCHCAVKVWKAVTVVSDQGADMTVIDAPLVSLEKIVQITESGATFGGNRQGFFVNPSFIGAAAVCARVRPSRDPAQILFIAPHNSPPEPMSAHHDGAPGLLIPSRMRAEIVV